MIEDQKISNIDSVVRDLQSRTILLLGFAIRYLFINIILSLQQPIYLFLLHNLPLNYIYNSLANIQILLLQVYYECNLISVGDSHIRRFLGNQSLLAKVYNPLPLI